MNNGSKIILTGVAAIALTAAAAWAIDVDVTGDVELPTILADADYQEGELPNVEVTGDFKMPTVTADVDAEGGELPKVDVDVVDVDVEKKEFSVPYPSIDVEKPEENVEAEQNDIDGQPDNES